MTPLFRKVLVANRGEIAVRIIATLDRMGIASVAVFSDADAGTAAVLRAGEAVRLGPGPAGESYLEKVGRLNMARLQAEERVLADLILIPPRSSSEQDEGNESARWHLETMRDRARLRQQDE